MRKQEESFLFPALVNSVGTFVYVTLIALVLTNGDRIFGEMNTLLGPIVFLMLFVLSVAIVGLLILGRPAMLYLDGKKQQAVQLLLQTIGWLAILTSIGLLNLLALF